MFAWAIPFAIHWKNDNPRWESVLWAVNHAAMHESYRVFEMLKYWPAILPSYLHPHFIFLWMRRDSGCWDAAIGCRGLIQPSALHTHTHTLGARRRHATLPQCIKGIRLPLTHTGEIERERVGRACSSFWFSLSRSLLLEPSDVIQVTYSSQTTPASSW